MDPVTTICYNKAQDWPTRQEAIAFFAEGVAVCDGSEKERYADILSQLVCGLSVCTDRR